MMRLVSILAAVLLAVLWVDPGFAAEPTTNSLDQIVQLYQSKSQAWQNTLATFAQTLFWLLATIELAYLGIRLAVKGAEFNEWVSEVVNQILFIGFFLALLNNAAGTNNWASLIVNSFRNAANQAVQNAGGSSMIAPSDVFGIGLKMANMLLDQTSLFSPGASIGLIIYALVLLVCFALIAAFLVLALVESYVVISAGVLFMGFGGSKWTKDFALKIMIYAMSVGAKLFILQLIIGLGQQIFNQLIQDFQANTSDVLVSVGSAIVMLALTKIIPEMIQGLINGTSAGGHGVLSGMVAGAAAGAAAASMGIAKGVTAGAYSAGMAWNAARSLASEQAAAGQPSSTVGNLRKAVFDTIGNRLSGQQHFGTFMGQMSDNIRAREQGLRESRGGGNP